MPLLGKSYRGRFPFRIATTSYILPDRIAPNIRALARYVDEVEVLLFEKGAPPEPAEIQEVAAILCPQNLTVNVHLPLDAALAHGDTGRRRADARLLRRCIERTRSWRPTSYCLHIVPPPRDPTRAVLGRWRRRAAEGLSLMLKETADPAQITVETLDYPFAWIDPLIEEFGLSVCVDLGHLFARGFDPMPIFERHGHRIAVLHLHGVADGRDHLPLDHMAPAFLSLTCEILKGFTGVVSIEVFSQKALSASLSFLETLAPPAPGRRPGNDVAAGSCP